MKMSKRIFIALLIVSVIVSLFAFSVFAAESGADEYDYLLEYFEEPVLFNYDFSSEDVAYSLFMSDENRDRITSAIVADENAPGGKYLAITVPESKGLWEDAIVQNNVYFNWNSESALDDFIINMTVSGSRGAGSEKQLPKIVVSVSGEVCTDPNAGAGFGSTLVALDFRSGCLSYLKKGYADEGVYTNTDFALTEDVWYSVSIQYDANSGFATVSVVDLSDETNTYSATDVYLPYSAVKNVRIGEHSVDGATSRDNVMKFASLCAFGGTYDRIPSGLQADVESGILAMHADFILDNLDLDGKNSLAELAAKISAYGFTTENEEVKAAYDELVAGIVPYCNTKLVEYAEAYGELFDYYERRELIDEALIYARYVEALDGSKIPADIADEVAANLATINGFDAVLENAKTASIALIRAVGTNTSLDYDNYAIVSARYEELYNIGGDYADPTYEGVTEAYNFYHTVRQAYQDIVTKGDRFINAANVLNSDADFNTRAEAFLICKNYYYDNTTYSNSNGSVTTALQIYNFHYETMNGQIEMAENFIKYVNKAAYADYVPMKLENLEEAKKYIACVNSDPYKGVLEAKATYDRVKAEVDEKVKNANLYIEAVNNLDNLAGDDLTNGIAHALELQKVGNVLGVEGVTDANIKLDQIISSIELSVKYRDYFLGLVASIDSASSPEELYNILKAAKLAEANADTTYQSVKDASAKLTRAIMDYNARVAAANAEFVTANQVAANTCGLGKGVNPVADRVIALIKKFFDEE